MISVRNRAPRLVVASLAALLLAAETSPSAEPFAREDIERIEDLVEDLANSLHELSFAIRERDLDAFASHFHEEFSGSDVPIDGGDPRPWVKWFSDRPVRAARTGLDRSAFVEAWGDYLARFESIEDVRIKVKKSRIEDGERPYASATVKFYWLGRNVEGHREWVKGVGRVEAEQQDHEDWKLRRFEIDEIHPHLSERDLFSEVGVSAGTALTIPRWGEPGNEVFLAHGVAVADVDLDGRVDVFVTGNHENFLYWNRGDGSFENRALEALIGVTPLATAPLFLDHDDDGDPDLFLAAVGRQMLYENRWIPDGELRFEEISASAGVDRLAHGYSALAGDVNSDGLVDVYVCSYNAYGEVMPNSWSDATNGTPNLLFLNRGDGTFTESAREWRCADSRWTYAGQFGDLNGDGRLDLYLANDFGTNAFYVNEGDRYRDASDEFGLVDTGNGMGVSFGDFDNDGALDVHVTNMSSTAGNRILKMVFPDEEETPEYARVLEKIAAGNTLFRAVDGKYEDVSKRLGPFSAGWAFGGGFVDFDNDGWEDLHSPNGFISGKGLKDT